MHMNRAVSWGRKIFQLNLFFGYKFGGSVYNIQTPKQRGSPLRACNLLNAIKNELKDNSILTAIFSKDSVHVALIGTG